jgi:anti-sigma-K factor RskA
MNYDDPELRDQLAAEYVLGTMPTLVRRRFERLLAADPALVRIVEDWTARLTPIDDAAAAEEPPAHISRALQRDLALPVAKPPTRDGWLGSIAFWRLTTLAASALAAAAIFHVVTRTSPPPVGIVAVLTDDKGDAGWVAMAGTRRDQVEVAPIGNIAVDAAHAFELWAIAEGTPHPLGLLTVEPGHKLTVQASLLPAGGVLAVSLEPAGGSPTGLPTGPVQYKGKLLPAREP